MVEKAWHDGRIRRLVDHISSAHRRKRGNSEGDRVLAGSVVGLWTLKSHFSDGLPSARLYLQKGFITSPVSATNCV